MTKKPNDAAKVAGLASILQTGNRQKDIPPSPAPPPSVAISAPPDPASVEPPDRRKKAERVGKYRDPGFQQVGLYLRKASVKQSRRKLEDAESTMDMSDLVQMLLERWLEADQNTS